jgi:hypothetical protein
MRSGIQSPSTHHCSLRSSLALAQHTFTIVHISAHLQQLTLSTVYTDTLQLNHLYVAAQLSAVWGQRDMIKQ